MNKIMQSLKFFYQKCNSAVASEILEMVKIGITFRLQNLSDKEVRESNPSLIFDLLETFKVYLARRNNMKPVDQLRVEFTKKLLHCDKIEHKLKGLEELNKIRKRVAVAAGKEPPDESDKNSEESDYFYLTYDFFLSWILQNEVLEMIFIDTVHPELIRRAFAIVRLLAMEDKIDKMYLEIIWNNAIDTHEDTVKATLELIQQVSEHLNMKCLQFLFMKVNEIPNTEYSELLINFLREYTLSAMKNYSQKENDGSGNIFQDAYKWLNIKNKSNERLKYFNLDKFWDIGNDETVTKPQVREKAVNGLIEILGSENCQLSSKVHYLTLSINNIISGNNYIEHCRLFKSIASKFKLYFTLEWDEFHKINDSFGGLIPLFVSKHQEVVGSQVKQNLLKIVENDVAKNGVMSENSKKIVEEHKQLYIESLDLISFVLERSKIILSNRDIETLFRIYIKDYKFKEHGQDLLYTFFMKRRLNGNNILDHQNFRYLFESIL